MSEVKFEIIKKVGVLSSPLRPSDTSPKSRSDLGEGECAVFMKFLISISHNVLSPPKSVFDFGGDVRRTEGASMN